VTTATNATAINTARLDAEADQHIAAVVDHTTWACDAFNLCDACRVNRDNAIARRHVARVERLRTEGLR
jgi:endo-1,4-beta-mannosidase